MHKRLLGLLATAAIVMAACGGATTTTAPPAASGPVASGDASAPPASGGLAAEQIVRIALPGEPPTLDPNAAQDANSLAVLRALHRPLVYIDKDLNVVDALAESHEISADAKTLTFHLRDAKYSNGDPIVAADLVYSWKRLVDPRTAAPYSYVMAEVAGAGDLLGMAGADPATPDAEVDAALEKLGVAAPDDKTFVVTLDTPATYFLSAMTLWVGVPIQEKWINVRGRDRGGELRQLGTVHARHVGPQQPDHPQAEPELVRRRQADADRDPDADVRGAGGGPGRVRDERSRHHHAGRQRGCRAGPGRPGHGRGVPVGSAALGSPTTTSTTATIRRARRSSLAARIPRPARRPTRTSGSP